MSCLDRVRIEPQRLLATLHGLAQFGSYKTGVHRPTYSPQDMAARNWIMDRMRDAGLEPEMDGIGNIIGRAPRAERRLLAGSHSDSQNHAGWLDGALGVVFALEIARAIANRGLDDIAVEPVVWADEEAHFGSFLGSRSAVGRLDEAEIDRSRNGTTGQPLREALAAAGLAGRPRMQIEPARYLGYLEAHIEQGEELDTLGLTLGVVTSIVGIWQYRLTFHGQRNHAGTTRMAVRRDAGAALVAALHEIDRRFRLVIGPRSVWTAGNITLSPGQPSIIPDRAELLLQIRDADPEVLGRMDRVITEVVAEVQAAGRCSAVSERLSASTPQHMDGGFRAALTRAAEQVVPGGVQQMPSGAGHDAQILASIMPAGMLFVPSIGGISHHWDENTADADIVAGCEAMAMACMEILGQTPEEKAQ